MTNLAAIDRDYRDIGDVPTEVIADFLEEASSPMRDTVAATNDAARPLSALFWAMAWMENQWGTTGILIQHDDHNPVAMRPWREDPDGHPAPVIDWKTRKDTGDLVTVSPYATGAIRDRYGSYMLRFPDDASAALEWLRRMTDNRYKDGVYEDAMTLREMVDIYCPPGDVHPETGVDNADIPYAGTVITMLQKFSAEERFMTDTGLVGDIVGELTDISSDESFVEPAFLPYLENADPGQLVVRNRDNIFFRVGEEMLSVRETPRFQRADENSVRTGEDLPADEIAYIEWAWIEGDGKLWLYSDWATRFRGTDFVLTDGAPLPVPDTTPDPDPMPEPEAPHDLGEVTAENFRLVENPSILLPPIIWEGSPNFFPNRQGYSPEAIYYHCTDDLHFPNTDSWFKTRGSNASSHFVIERNGVVHQYVSSTDASWTNGDVRSPRRDIPALNAIVDAGINPNNTGISYEFIATPGVPPTEAQYVSAIQLSRYFCHPDVYDINPNRSHQRRHADVNSETRSYCPGPNFDLERIILALGGDPTQLAV